MLIESMLAPERTLAQISGPSKKRVIENVAKTFAESLPTLDVEELYQNIINREKLGSTGIGGGVAIPHCRCHTGGGTYGACITLEQPIDFDSVDNLPVDIIFAMLVPENAESEHLETLSNLAEKLQDANFVSNLRKAKDSVELFNAATHT